MAAENIEIILIISPRIFFFYLCLIGRVCRMKVAQTDYRLLSSYRNDSELPTLSYISLKTDYIFASMCSTYKYVKSKMYIILFFRIYQSFNVHR